MDVLLDNIYTLHPADSKTNVCIDVPVTRDYAWLEMKCSYAPKVLEDEERARKLIEEGIERYVPAEFKDQCGDWREYLPVVSLITISLDYKNRYIGCAHRHHKEQRHVISENFSSPGFFKQAVLAGNWRAVINVHYVANDNVDYHLIINAYGKDDKPYDSV